MTKNEQALLCMLLAKMRYYVNETLLNQNISITQRKDYQNLLQSINRIMTLSINNKQD